MSDYFVILGMQQYSLKTNKPIGSVIQLEPEYFPAENDKEAEEVAKRKADVAKVIQNNALCLCGRLVLKKVTIMSIQKGIQEGDKKVIFMREDNKRN